MEFTRNLTNFFPKFFIVFFLIIFVASFSVSLTILFLGSQSPALLSPAQEIETVPIEDKNFDDARNVEFAVMRSDDNKGISPAAGLITNAACIPGQPIQSGGTNFSIDGLTLLNLSTSFPLWRDIEPGTKGADVAALQTELQRLGYSLDVTEKYDWQTISAVRDVFEKNGSKALEEDVLPVSQVLWLSAGELLPGSCTAKINQRVNPGDVLFRIASGLAELRVVSMPDNLSPGDRVAVFGDLRVPISAQTGVIDDPEILAQVASIIPPQDQSSSGNGKDSGAAGSSDSGSAGQKIEAKFVLATPLKAFSIPPSSLVAVNAESQGCIVDDRGTPIPVTIVGSQLGVSFVTLDDTFVGKLGSISLTPSEGVSCR